MLFEILIFILTTLTVYFLYSHYKVHRLFDKKGLKYLPGIPILGNTFKSNFLTRHIIDDVNEVYFAFPGERYVGYIEATSPIYLIRDPEIIKQITVKDFDYFMDHRQFFMDQFFSNTLLMMTGDKWRDMRATMSPAFTGSKMRQMVPFMVEISKNVIQHIKENEGQIMDVGDLVRRYTNDVIASTGFGLQINSLVDKENKFYTYGQSLMNFGLKQRLVMIFSQILWKKIGEYIPMFDPEITDFFREIVQKTMDHRIKNNIERPDMIQLLLEAKKGKLKMQWNAPEKDIGFAVTEEMTKPQGEIRKWTQDELAAQAFIFFFAAFESSASVIAMAIHELMLNPTIQDKLYKEVKAHAKKDADLSYDDVQHMKYLDAVINETLRKWTPGLVLDRSCLKTYELPPPREGGKPCTLQPGDVVYSVVNSLHKDGQYYPNPEKFDPSRFLDENKDSIQNAAYLPFGSGPRNCIGSRFALLELKVFLFYLILNFEIIKKEGTPEKIELSPGAFNIRVKGGTFAKFRSRN